MREVPIDYLAVLLAGISNMVIGFFWYSSYGLGNPWMRLTGRTKESMAKEKMNMPKIFGLSFLTALLMAYVLSHNVIISGEYFNLQGVNVGLQAGFWAWVGFVMPVQLSAYLYEKQPFQLFLIHTGYWLVSLLVMGVILTTV